MRRVFFVWAIVIVGASVLHLTACKPRQADDEKEVSDWKRLITSGIEDERRAGKRTALKDRHDVIAYLLSVVNGPVREGENFHSSGSSRNIAIGLLGELRAKEAVADLANWLSAKPGQVEIFSSLERYVVSHAGLALIGIGLPSVQPVMQLVKSEGTSRLGEQCVRIVAKIKGLRETELLFEDVIAEETDSAKKENLKAAQELLKDPKFRKVVEKM